MSNVQSECVWFTHLFFQLFSSPLISDRFRGSLALLFYPSYYPCHLWLKPQRTFPTHLKMLLPFPAMANVLLTPLAADKPYTGDTASEPVSSLVQVQLLKAAPKVASARVNPSSFKVICQFPCHFLLLECFSPQRKPLEVKHHCSRWIWQPPFLWGLKLIKLSFTLILWLTAVLKRSC